MVREIFHKVAGLASYVLPNPTLYLRLSLCRFHRTFIGWPPALRSTATATLGRNAPQTVGHPERFAQEALRHNSKAVHRAYANRALMKLPSLEDCEQRAAEKVEQAA
jgi:hypothetical protein